MSMIQALMQAYIPLHRKMLNWNGISLSLWSSEPPQLHGMSQKINCLCKWENEIGQLKEISFAVKYSIFYQLSENQTVGKISLPFPKEENGNILHLSRSPKKSGSPKKRTQDVSCIWLNLYSYILSFHLFGRVFFPLYRSRENKHANSAVLNQKFCN